MSEHTPLTEREALLTRVRERLEHEQRWEILGRESNVRCLDCDLRYGERDQFGCHETGRGHTFDEEELAEARTPQPDDIDRDLAALLALAARTSTTTAHEFQWHPVGVREQLAGTGNPATASCACSGWTLHEPLLDNRAGQAAARDEWAKHVRTSTATAEPLSPEVERGVECYYGTPGACTSYRCGSNCDQRFDRMHPCPACLIREIADLRAQVTATADTGLREAVEWLLRGADVPTIHSATGRVSAEALHHLRAVFDATAAPTADTGGPR